MSNRAALARRPALLAGAHARRRGPALRRAARAADAAVRRPAEHGDRPLRSVRAGDERSAPTARCRCRACAPACSRASASAPTARAREGSRGLLAAANRALRDLVRERVQALEGGAGRGLRARPGAELLWRAPPSRACGRRGRAPPQVDVLPSDLLDPPLRERVRRRLAAWLEGHLRARAGAALRAARARALGRRARPRLRSRRGPGRRLAPGVAQQVAALTTRTGARSPGSASARRFAVFLPALAEARGDASAGAALRRAAGTASGARSRRRALGAERPRASAGLLPGLRLPPARPARRAAGPAGACGGLVSRLARTGPFVAPRELPGILGCAPGSCPRCSRPWATPSRTAASSAAAARRAAGASPASSASGVC